MPEICLKCHTKHSCSHTNDIHVHPGITAEYSKLHCQGRDCHHEGHPHVLEITHCHYGRVGWDLVNGTSIYMGEGDTTLHSTMLCYDSSMHFPLNTYEGITITIDFDELEQSELTEPLQAANLDFSAIRESFCRTDQSVTFAAGDKIDEIIGGLYHLPESLQLAYLKIKTIEVLLYLSQQTMSAPETNGYRSDVIETIREIQAFITEDLAKRYTIQDLSTRYLINTSTLKDAFKVVYGMPIATYMKDYRIRHAAREMTHTDLSIAEIAASVGYETPSKFTKVFKEVMGVLPSEYRR